MRTIEENYCDNSFKDIFTCPMKGKDLDSPQETHKT